MNAKKNRAAAIILLIIIFVIIAIVANIKRRQQPALTKDNSVAIYFVESYDNEFSLTPVKRKIHKGEDRLKIALNELLKGPDKNEKNLGYFTEIPEETKIIEIKEAPERVIINLSQEFEQGGGSASMTLRLKQLVNTVLDSVEEKPVYLELNGKQVKHIGGEGVMVPQPLTKNLDMGQDI